VTVNIGQVGVAAVGSPRSPDLPDRELWGQVSGGSHAAFAELFRRHLKSVWNHAYRLTGSQHIAEDVASNTFLTVWRKRSQVVLVSDSALPWLLAVAGNLARDEYKSSRRRIRLTRRVVEPVVVPDHADSTADRVDGESGFRRLVAAIQRLPPSQRRAVELCLVAEMSQPDAAAVLGVGEVTLRSNLSRARARLREMVEVQEARA
jgi:RNA polymerase sigma factor (sigma-70 family)